MAAEMEWLDEINPDELPEPYRDISKMIGLRNTLKLADKYQGTAIYLPKLDALVRRARDERIRAEFNGGNYRALARKYGLTETWVRQVIAEGLNADKNQISMFEMVSAK